MLVEVWNGCPKVLIWWLVHSLQEKSSEPVGEVQVSTCAQVDRPCVELNGCLSLQGESEVRLKCGHVLPVMSMTSLSKDNLSTLNLPVVDGIVNTKCKSPERHWL